MIELAHKKEIAIAVTMIKKGSDRDEALEHLDELIFLCETAGAEVIEKFHQELQAPRIQTLIGKGKVEEIAEFIKENEVKMVVFDEDLSTVQVRNLEKAFEVKVMDRSGIILDIFANRAKTLEAKTQVELAQMQYMMPRLTRMWTHLSKQYGGIGTKGPGETQIETDRRIIRNKIQHLKKKLIEIEDQKATQRKSRSKYPRFSLVGYTNAGKSTLMRAITEAEVYIEDKLFATLDTTVRGFDLPSGKKALLSDTVGFIRKLPPHLVASFRSTLAEARESDVILHVADISHENIHEHISIVEETLENLGIHEKPSILVLNKVDAVEDYYAQKAIENDYPEAIFISAVEGRNIDMLLKRMQDIYDENTDTINIVLPYTSMEKVSDIYEFAEIVKKTEKDEGIEFELRIHDEKMDYFNRKFSQFIN